MNMLKKTLNAILVGNPSDVDTDAPPAEEIRQERLLVKPNNYHFRFVDENGNFRRGGVTVTYRPIMDEEDNLLGVQLGCAVCSPCDNYSKKRGRLIASCRGQASGLYSLKYLTRDHARDVAWKLALFHLTKVLLRLLEKNKITLAEFESFFTDLRLVTRNSRDSILS